MASVTLGSYFDAFVKAQVESGRFNNVSEVVRAGLRLLDDEIQGRPSRGMRPEAVAPRSEAPAPARQTGSAEAGPTLAISLKDLRKKTRRRLEAVARDGERDA